MAPFTFWKLVRNADTDSLTYTAMPYIRLYSNMVEVHLSPPQRT